MDKVKQFFSGSSDESPSTNTAESTATTGHTDTATGASTATETVGKPDLGEQLSSAVEPASFSTETTAGTTGGTTQAATLGDGGSSSLPDRSVVAQSSEGAQVDTSGRPDSHSTFTANRLDPRFEESTSTFHEEKLNDKTHQGGGWKSDAVDTSAPATTTSTTSAGISGQDDTGPASKTLGPHDSNLANIVDPRVQPDIATVNKNLPETQSGSTTGAAGATDTAGHTTSDFATGASTSATGTGAVASQDTTHASRDAATAGHTVTSGSHDAHATSGSVSQDPTGATTAHHQPKAQDIYDPVHEKPQPALSAFAKEAASPETAMLPTLSGTEALSSIGNTDKPPHAKFLDKLLHRDHPNKLHKDPPS